MSDDEIQRQHGCVYSAIAAVYTHSVHSAALYILKTYIISHIKKPALMYTGLKPHSPVWKSWAWLIHSPHLTPSMDCLAGHTTSPDFLEVHLWVFSHKFGILTPENSRHSFVLALAMTFALILTASECEASTRQVLANHSTQWDP